ncbi:MAG: hypothetical protein LBK18_01780 [Prevotellaceae bacterium]|jgi:hypothetical protein|nr:hypothetical protein [Prevotellaceae bacterium]
MKTLKFFLFSMLVLSMGTACSEKDTPEEKQELTGTKWKLANIRNLATGELRTLDASSPSGKKEEEYFSFTFENDTTGSGRSCANHMYVNIKSSDGRYLYITTEIADVTDDCRYFTGILPLVDDCFFEKDLLIFAYTQDDVRYQLQFKQVKE